MLSTDQARTTRKKLNGSNGADSFSIENSNIPAILIKGSKFFARSIEQMSAQNQRSFSTIETTGQ